MKTSQQSKKPTIQQTSGQETNTTTFSVKVEFDLQRGSGGLHTFLDFALMTLNSIFFGEHLIVLFMKTCSLGSRSATVLVDRNSNAQAAYEDARQ